VGYDQRSIRRTRGVDGAISSLNARRKGNTMSAVLTIRAFHDLLAQCAPAAPGAAYEGLRKQIFGQKEYRPARVGDALAVGGLIFVAADDLGDIDIKQCVS
jgi:hypothetical protein